MKRWLFIFFALLAASALANVPRPKDFPQLNDTRLNGVTASYGYDPIGQLVSAVANEAGGALRKNENLGYAYDASHNLTSVGDSVLPGTGDAAIFARISVERPRRGWQKKLRVLKSSSIVLLAVLFSGDAVYSRLG